MKSFVQHIFFGNYFYSICVLALTIETTLQLELGFLNPCYYILLMLGTVLYYTKAYTHLNDATSTNKRVQWYFNYSKTINKLQVFYLAAFVLLGSYYVYFLLSINEGAFHAVYYNLLFLIPFPLTAILYYGLPTKGLSENNFRKIGWLKPFIIGFTWAGLVSIYPSIFYSLESDVKFQLSFTTILLFIKNMMFVCTLCIMFDIKDYAADYNKEIKTFVVTYGLRRTIFYILVPLCIVGLVSFLITAYVREFSSLKIFFNLTPFVALLIVAYSLKKRKAILYYLIIIDGLLLLKGICGSLSVYF